MITKNMSIFILAAMVLRETASSKREKIPIPTTIAFSTPLCNSMLSITAGHQFKHML